MARKPTKEFTEAFANLTDVQQAKVRELTLECSKASAAYGIARDAEQDASKKQRKAFMSYEKQCRAMGLPVPKDICFR